MASHVVRLNLKTPRPQSYSSRFNAPLINRAGLFERFLGHEKLQARKCSQLDRLYQRVMNDRGKLIEAVGPPSTTQQRE